MALVSKDKNKRVGSKSFEEKKHQLFSLQTEFSLTESISEFDKWDKDSIDQRQKLLAEHAIKTWRIEIE